jgi:hypothetical protein
MVSIKISLVHSLPNGTAEINSLFVVMAAYFKLLCIKLSYTCCLMRCSQSVKQGRKVHIMCQKGAFPFVLPGSFGRWSCYLLHCVATDGLGGSLRPQDCSLNIGFLNVYYVSCRCSGTVPCDDSAMLEWLPL